ncbi:hypothetical protein CPC08DRAFT_719410 [Agrocybe pediades]|nr:hypothetical protein CPC08DRAFT_719410 [Agrocybe pediades]
MPAPSLSDEDFINKSLLDSLNADSAHDDNTDNDHNDSQPIHFFPQYPNKNINRASFTSYPNTTRARQQSVLNNSHPYYPPNDAFSPPITSPHIPSYDPRASYEYPAPPNGLHKPFQVDPYPHKPHNQQPYPTSAQYPTNGISQTPYGPHVPTVNPPSSQSGPPGLTSVSMNIVNGASNSNNNSNGEEISTIFVVGFPEDMQEREFQNMFTFSQGFEAATLKIPNKEYTAYGSILGGPPGGTLPSLRPSAGFQYAGPNDPYNLVTVNQGGVVVDGGRDGTMASWPAAAPTDDMPNNGLYLPGGPNGPPAMGLPVGSNPAMNIPRKQIIGFAKFRSREEALAARDILQGRRVDIEKGAVLKAEMAKKNLHTKRGVGPVPGAGGLSVIAQQQQQQQQLLNGSDMYNNESYPNVGGLSNGHSSNRESLPIIGRLGGRDSIANLQQQAQMQTFSQSDYPAANGITPIPSDPEDRFNRAGGIGGLNMAALSLLPSNGVAPMTNSSASPNMAAATTQGGLAGLSQQRGARERAEDEEQWRRRNGEREREAQEKEANLMRLRANNTAAFDAFHGLSSSFGSNTSTSSSHGGNGSSAVGASLMSRQNSTASTTSLSSGSGPAAAAVVSAGSPMLGGGGNGGDDVGYFQAQQQSYKQPQKQEASTPGDSNTHQSQQEDREGSDSNEDRDAPHHHDEIVGPWDRVNNAVANQPIMRPTESERSTSPPLHDVSSQSQSQGGYQYRPQYMHLHEQQQQFQAGLYQQKQPQQYRGSSQSDSSETGSVVGGELSPSANPGSPNPIGYVGARLGFVDSNQRNGGQNAQSPEAQSQVPMFNAQALFSKGLSGYMNATVGGGSGGSGVSNNSESGASASSVTTNPSVGRNANTSSGGSGSTSATGSGSGGNTSPTLPSPASGSTTSVTSAGTNGNGTSSSVRGTVDQNPPINTLYVGNLPTSPPPIGYPSDYLEETLREIFSARPGYRKLCFRHKANGPMCFVEFEDVQYAAKALQEMSGNTLRGAVKNGIRLSYSKNPLGVRTPTSAGSNSGGPTLQQQQQLMQTLNNHQAFSNHNNHQSTGSNGTSSTSAGVADDFSQPPISRVSLPASIMRRDSTLSLTGPTQPTSLIGNNGNGNGGYNGNNNFFSPPPRFYATSPSSTMPFGSTNSTPLTGASNAFVPRSAAGTTANGSTMIFNGGHFGFGGVPQTAFSPFGVPFSSSSSSTATAPSSMGGEGLQPLSIPDQQHHDE